MLTLLVIPVLYTVFDNVATALMRIFRRMLDRV
jgi:hypothetical protein